MKSKNTNKSHHLDRVAEVRALLTAGEALRAANRLPEAIAEFHRAMTLAPEHEGARFALGRAWLEAGEANRAKDILSPLLQTKSPYVAEVVRAVAEADAMLALQRDAPVYVRHLFDQFSADYDSRMLGELAYRAPSILRGLADLMLGVPERDLDILDLGCGTGLAGAVFADIAARLDGVDLSPLMIEKARERGLYDDLIVADIEAALYAEGRAYDLLVAADTLVYLGDLGPAFAGAARRLKPGGFFFFTVEKKTGDGFERGPKRRYRHSESYLREAAAHAGLEVMGAMDCSPREEANQPVEGMAVALQKL